MEVKKERVKKGTGELSKRKYRNWKYRKVERKKKGVSGQEQKAERVKGIFRCWEYGRGQSRK